MSNTPKPRIFIQNPNGEPAGYIGDWGKYGTVPRVQLGRAVADFFDAELENAIGGQESAFDLKVMIKIMTDAEVEALPEL